MVIDSAPLVAGACPMPTLVFHTDTLEALDCRVWYGPGYAAARRSGATGYGAARERSYKLGGRTRPAGNDAVELGHGRIVGRSGSSEGEVAADGFGLHRVAGVVAD